MIATIKRQLSLYFSNKASVFFSLMGAWVSFALYVIFLQKNMLDAWSAASHPEEMLDKWVMGGILAVTSVTTTWTGVCRLIKDRENQQFADFLLTGTSQLRLHLGYLLSSSIIGFSMQVIMFAIMSSYFYWQDGLTVKSAQFPALLSLMLLSSLLGAGLGMIIGQLFKTVEASERFTVIMGTASGFLVGVYMPIGGLPDLAQTVIKFTPAAYVAAAFRQILIEDSLVEWNRTGIDVKEYLGIGLKWENLTSLNQNLLLISALVAISLLLLFVLLLRNNPKKGMIVSI